MHTMLDLPSQTAFMHIDLNEDGELVGLFQSGAKRRLFPVKWIGVGVD